MLERYLAPEYADALDVAKARPRRSDTFSRVLTQKISGITAQFTHIRAPNNAIPAAVKLLEITKLKWIKRESSSEHIGQN